MVVSLGFLLPTAFLAAEPPSTQLSFNGQRDASKTPDDVEAALKLIFVGDSDQLGANTQTLTITAATDPQYKYLVMRRVNILDQGTGQIIGYGESENDIKNVEESPFAGQEAFFPKPAGE
jgi:hypothetical protein